MSASGLSSLAQVASVRANDSKDEEAWEQRGAAVSTVWLCSTVSPAVAAERSVSPSRTHPRGKEREREVAAWIRLLPTTRPCKASRANEALGTTTVDSDGLAPVSGLKVMLGMEELGHVTEGLDQSSDHGWR